jgi:hypothetical protein
MTHGSESLRMVQEALGLPLTTQSAAAFDHAVGGYVSLSRER